MKKQYVKPQFNFISNLSHLESIKQWNNPESIEKPKYTVEVAYADNERFTKHFVCQREK